MHNQINENPAHCVEYPITWEPTVPCCKKHFAIIYSRAEFVFALPQEQGYQQLLLLTHGYMLDMT